MKQLESLILPAKVTLQNGTKTALIEKGEKFLITCVSIEVVEGKVVMITDIGTIEMKSDYDLL